MGRIFTGWVITGLSTLANTLAWWFAPPMPYSMSRCCKNSAGDAPRQPWDIPSPFSASPTAAVDSAGSLVPLWLAICSIVPRTYPVAFAVSALAIIGSTVAAWVAGPRKGPSVWEPLTY